jgi:peptidoglycan/LPS O-acetylase OafA/YrhL
MNKLSVPYIGLLTVSVLILYIFLPLPQFLYFRGKTLLNILIPSSALLNMGIIWYASNGIKGFLKYILEHKVFLYIGRIGYGLYLYHLLVPDLRMFLLRSLTLPVSNSSVLYFIDAALLLIVATISYFLIEKPVYSLKRRFSFSA